ncbi:MAG: hypothetical protein WD492_08200 [Alkalispirochaeta sp.]
MERNLRIAAPIAGGAAIISLLVGLLAGVPLGIALLRAVLAGGLFGALTFVAAFVARTQLSGFEESPEMAEPVRGKEDEDSDRADSQSVGSRLNIVVEDEGEPQESEAPEDAQEPEGTDESPQSEQFQNHTAGNQSGVAGRFGSAEPTDDDDGEANELVEEVQESSAEDEEAVMDAAISEEQDGTSVEIDDTMLDEMPDIGKYSGAFVSEGDSETDGDEALGDAGESGGYSSGRKQKTGDPRKGFDNKTIAKALQTFMAKDNE